MRSTFAGICLSIIHEHLCAICIFPTYKKKVYFGFSLKKRTTPINAGKTVISDSSWKKWTTWIDVGKLDISDWSWKSRKLMPKIQSFWFKLRRFDSVMLRGEARDVPSPCGCSPLTCCSLRTRHFVYVFTYFFPKRLVSDQGPSAFLFFDYFSMKMKVVNFISPFFIRDFYVQRSHNLTLP